MLRILIVNEHVKLMDPLLINFEADLVELLSGKESIEEGLDVLDNFLVLHCLSFKLHNKALYYITVLLSNTLYHDLEVAKKIEFIAEK